MSEFFNWNDDITADSDEFVVLMPGKYEAEITKIEKKRQSGGKLDGCPFAFLTFCVTLEDGTKAFVNDNLFLAKSMEWKIGKYLGACGLKQKGQAIKVSAIDNSIHKKVWITVGCKYGKDKAYAPITSDEEARAAVAKGEAVYNEIKNYEPIKTEASDPIADDEFGF